MPPTAPGPGGRSSRSTEPTTSRRRVVSLGMGATASAVLAPAGERVGAQSTPEAIPAAATYELPGGRVFPEGIAYDPASAVFYVGSTEDGTVYRGDLATGVVEVFLQGGQDERTAVTGLKADDAGRLIVCGRRTGRVFVYDTADGTLLARYSNGLSEGTLINDVAIAPGGDAYVTDSFAPTLLRVELAALPIRPAPGSTPVAEAVEQRISPFLDFTGTVLEYVAGEFNANGIVATPDGSALLIVQFNTGRLYRIELATRGVVEVTLTGGDLRGGDGMALDGRTLWCLLDTTGELVRVELNQALTEGVIAARIVDPTFDYPTTLALVGDGTALVVNSQLDMAGGDAAPALPFTVSRITLPA